MAAAHRIREGNYLAHILFQVERKIILNTLKRLHGNVTRTACFLGVNRTHLYQRMIVLEIPCRYPINKGNAAWQALGEFDKRQ